MWQHNADGLAIAVPAVSLVAVPFSRRTRDLAHIFPAERVCSASRLTMTHSPRSTRSTVITVATLERRARLPSSILTPIRFCQSYSQPPECRSLMTLHPQSPAVTVDTSDLHRALGKIFRRSI